MINMLIEDIGQGLSHKPFEWKSWWWGIKWETFIDIYPQLTETNPLWQREDSHLKNIRLCGLPPDELQKEIAAYWEKPFWRRWILSFFTGIDNKIVIWSYYKRCLSFRIIHKENPTLEKRLMVYDPEQRLVNLLINKLKQDNEKLENRLERYSGNATWIEKNLDILLAKHEEKRQRFFLKLLNKHLKMLPEECDQGFVRKKLKEEYQELEKMLRNYVKNSCQANVSQQESILPEDNFNRDLVYVGPTVLLERSVTAITDNDLGCSISEVNIWVSSIRTKIEDMLKEECPSYEAIQALLRESLVNLQLLIQTQLNHYQDLIDEAPKGVHPREGLKWLEFLETRLNILTSFFRSSVLLFHPDKSYGDENIRLIKTELFKEFHQFGEDSLKKLHQGLKTLKRCIPKWEINLDKMLKEIARERKEFRQWFDQKFEKMEAENAEMKKRQAQLQADINAMEIEISTLTKKMNPHMFYSEKKKQEQTLNCSLPRP